MTRIFAVLCAGVAVFMAGCGTNPPASLEFVDVSPPAPAIGEIATVRFRALDNRGVPMAGATVNFKETGIILSVTPHITNNRHILMTLHSERSNLQPAASDLGYTFQKQRADNQLLVADGETAVIGGLTVTEVTVSKVGIPILVDLPLIGKLFGQTTTREEKRDRVILVTPHIIDEGESIAPPGGR